ncbi:MAG: hypothetical protein ACE366_07595 [Bradymonadia bacterium]
MHALRTWLGGVIALTFTGCLEPATPRFFDSGVVSADRGLPSGAMDASMARDASVVMDAATDSDGQPPERDMSPEADADGPDLDDARVDAPDADDPGFEDARVDDPEDAFRPDASPPGELFGGGSGSPDDPYIVSNRNHLHNVRCRPDAHFLMSRSIILREGERRFLPIGGGLAPSEGCPDDQPFTGSFNGGGHVICNLDIEVAERNVPAGLFSTISSGSVSNLKLLVTWVNAGLEPAGMVAGRILNAGRSPTLHNVSVSGTITGGGTTGGVAGYIEGATANRLGARVAVEGHGPTGAIFGHQLNTLTDEVLVTQSDAQIGGQRQNHPVGGVAGLFEGEGRINNFQVDLNILNNNAFGGVAGRADTTGTIGYGYTRGALQGEAIGGGLVGHVVNLTNLSWSFTQASVFGDELDVGAALGRIEELGRVSAVFFDPLEGEPPRCAGLDSASPELCRAAPTVDNPSYFYHSENSPMAGWNGAIDGPTWAFPEDDLPELIHVSTPPIICLGAPD